MLNKTCMMGRLVKDAEVRKTATGTSVCSFTIACERDYATNGERGTDFVDCVAWRGTADFVARNFHKGDSIIVTGRIQTRTYDTDAGKRKAVEVVIDNAYFCGVGKHAETAEGQHQQLASVDDDRLPWE